MSGPRYESYRESGVEWLGKVPSHWKVQKLSRVTASRCDGPFGSGLKSEHYVEHGVRVIRLQNIASLNFDGKDAAYIAEGYYETSLVGHSVQAGDVLIAGLGDEKSLVGRACVAPDGIGPAMVKADCFRYRLIDKAIPCFVAAQLTCSAAYDAGVLSTGVTRSRISLSSMSTRTVAIPPVSEQRRIVEFLDAELAKIDELVEAQRRLVELLKEKRQAVIAHTVTKGLDPTAPTKPSGIECLGDVPAHWKLVRLKQLGSFYAGAGFPHDEQGVEGEELQFYKVADLGRADNGERLVASRHTISRNTAQRLRAFIFPEGAIVFAKIGAALLLGRIRQLKCPSCLDNNMMGFVASPGLNPTYARYLFHLTDFTRIANPGAVPSLNEGQVACIGVAVPERVEQLAIVQYLDSFMSRTEALIAQAEDGISLFQERRLALILAAVTGQIDVLDIRSSSTAEAA